MRLPRWSLPVSIFSVVTQVAHASEMREALLCEEHRRYELWYADPSKLEAPLERDGVSMQRTKARLPCGGDDVGVLFGHFKLHGAAPIDLFNVVVNWTDLPNWEATTDQVTRLGDYPPEAIRGGAVSYVSHPWPAREFYQWQVVSADVKRQDFWVASTTDDNADLKKQKSPQGGAVEAQNCLAGYHIRLATDGATEVFWTTQLNPHPWLLSADFVFNFIWGKQVDHCLGLMKRAREYAASHQGDVTQLAVPEWMLGNSSRQQVTATSNGAHFTPPFASCLATYTPVTGAGTSAETVKNFTSISGFPSSLRLYSARREDGTYFGLSSRFAVLIPILMLLMTMFYLGAVAAKRRLSHPAPRVDVRRSEDEETMQQAEALVTQ